MYIHIVNQYILFIYCTYMYVRCKALYVRDT